jgi:hypothetical protein
MTPLDILGWRVYGLYVCFGSNIVKSRLQVSAVGLCGDFHALITAPAVAARRVRRGSMSHAIALFYEAHVRGFTNTRPPSEGRRR